MLSHPSRSLLSLAAFIGVLVGIGTTAEADEDALKKAVTFYASFDDAVKADFGGGDVTLFTGVRPEPGKPKPPPIKGFEGKAFSVSKKGIAGGCLEATDLLPNNGRLFFPAKGNLAYQKGGWGGAMSMWINFDPDTMLKGKFCDPVQITHKGAHNGAIWFDFNDAKPRDMRHGAYTALKEGEKPIPEEDPKAPLVRVPKVGFKNGDWHHIVLSWKNFDTGKPDAVSQFWVDGKLIGEVKDRAISMDWDIDQVGIFTAISYIGLLDEFALFNRPLTPEEIATLHKQPAALQTLKKADAGGREEERRKIAALVELHRGLARTNQGQSTLKPETAGRGEVVQEVLNAVEASIKAPTGQRHKTQTLILRFLQSEQGQIVAEECVSLLGRYPPRGDPAPEPPKFPFTRDEAQRYQKSYAEWAGLPVEFVNGIGMSFRLVPPGTFLMGTPDDEPGRSKEYDETQHPVTLTQPFYLAKYETSVGQFRRFVAARDYVTDVEKTGGGNAHDEKAVWKHRAGTQWRKPGFAGAFDLRDEHPVVHVSWTDSEKFCDWLNQTRPYENLVYGLPTEAQWEWACRAGSGARYWWGAEEDASGAVANVGDRSLKKAQPAWPRSVMDMDDGHAFLAPVGSYRANAFGLHDMLGNVWEFCGDRYRTFTKEAATDPVGKDEKRGYAVRGGGWSNIAADVRNGSRNADPPHFGHSNLGFRVALVLPVR